MSIDARSARAIRNSRRRVRFARVFVDEFFPRAVN
jgi:hypothetical protein